jgi:hypothetical protein
VLGVFLANVFNPEVVDDKGECDWSPLVCPKARRGLALRVAMFLQPFGQEFLCNDPCLGKTVHALLDFAINLSVWGCNVE